MLRMPIGDSLLQFLMQRADGLPSGTGTPLQVCSMRVVAGTNLRKYTIT